MVLELGEVARERDAELVGARDHERAGHVRAAEPLLTGDRVVVDLARLDWDHAGRLRAVDENRETCLGLDPAGSSELPVTQETCEIAIRRVRSVAASTTLSSGR